MSDNEQISIAGAAFRVVGKLLLFLGFGVLANAAFGVYFLIMGSSATYAARLLFLIFFFGIMPLYFLWRVRIFAIRATILEIYRKGEGVLEQLVKRVCAAVLLKAEKNEKLKNKDLAEAGKEAKEALNLPFPLNWGMNYLLRRVPLKESFDEVAEEVPLKHENADLIGAKVFEKVDEYIEQDVIQGGLGRFWILFGINLLLMGAAYYYYIYQT
ncbi:MAG: hypothetical protein AAFV80_01650 [Bacteroidota bacterium]